MAKKKSGLGRGLGEILGEITEAYENEIPTEHEINSIAIEDIQTNPYQPRKTFAESSLKELSSSIKQHGLLQPVVVSKQVNGYILIAGERRLRASKIANLTHIKATIVDADPSKFHELALIENIQRDDLNPIELAQSYDLLLNEHSLTHEQLSSRVLKSRTQITNTLRLLGLGRFAQKALIEKKITQGHAKVLVGLEPKSEETFVNSIIGQKLSVRDVEQMVKKVKNDTNLSSVELNQPSVGEKSEKLDLKGLEELFSQLNLGLVTASKSITLKFSSQEEVEKTIKSLSFNKDLSNK